MHSLVLLQRLHVGSIRTLGSAREEDALFIKLEQDQVQIGTQLSAPIQAKKSFFIASSSTLQSHCLLHNSIFCSKSSIYFNSSKMKLVAILFAAPALFAYVMAVPVTPPGTVKLGPGAWKPPVKPPGSIGTLTISGRDESAAPE